MGTKVALTLEQYAQLPEEELARHVYDEGELIPVASATPRHNRVVQGLYVRIDRFLESEGRGGALLTDTDLLVDDEKTRRPDVAYYTPAVWARVDQTRIPVREMPAIAIEVISPSESAQELEQKLALYRAAGIAEVWAVYEATRHVLIYTPQGVREFFENTPLTSDQLPGFTLDLKAFFDACAA